MNAVLLDFASRTHRSGKPLPASSRLLELLAGRRAAAACGRAAGEDEDALEGEEVSLLDILRED